MLKTVTLVSPRADSNFGHLQQIAEKLELKHERISIFGDFLNALNDAKSCPDLALFDIQSLQQFNELSLVEIINMIHSISFCSHAKKTPILAVMIDEMCDKQLLSEIQGTDIKGYVLDDFEEAKYAIIELLAGRHLMPRNILSKFKKPDETISIDNTIKLTARQQQVLKLVCNRGLSNKAIAQVLKISESTVKIHISAILKAYGVRNRTQLALAFSDSLK